jgi:hypothetical protein
VHQCQILLPENRCVASIGGGGRSEVEVLAIDAAGSFWCGFLFLLRHKGRFDLLKRDVWLSLEADLLGHARLAPTFAVYRPILRQIETIQRRQTGVVIGKGQRHRDLAVILFAKLPQY